MLWDNSWEENEHFLRKLSVRKKIDLVCQCVNYSVEYLQGELRAQTETGDIREGLRKLLDAVAEKRSFNKAERILLESLIEKYEDDDVNTESPGVLDALLAFKCFEADLSHISNDDVCECLSFCYQAIHNNEILGSMLEGEALDEDELEQREKQNAKCLDCLEFQFKSLSDLSTG